MTIILAIKRRKSFYFSADEAANVSDNREPKSRNEVTVRTHSKYNDYNKKQGFGGAGSDCH